MKISVKPLSQLQTKGDHIKMGTTTSSFSIISVSLVVLLSVSLGISSTLIHQREFLECLSLNSTPVYTPNSPNFTFILESTIDNLRFLSPLNPKPFLLITPLNESHVQAAVICSKKYGIQIRVRSGGHDVEGLSYLSDVPFVVVDMSEFRSINVNVEESTAWVESGATLGEVYYRISEQSPTLGFPAGICPTVGIGGHISGGGQGTMQRKYGLASDNVIDARLVDASGRILDKESMGEDLFWAIRGGGGGSFGVVLSWKIRLVPVPPTVAVFTIKKTGEQSATTLVYRWQEIAHKLPRELYIEPALGKEEETIQASFQSMYLGDCKKLLIVMNEKFPELGFESKDCIEMSWIQSVLYFSDEFPIDAPLDVLLNTTRSSKLSYKYKTDYVKEPISLVGLKELWSGILKEEQLLIFFQPYGGRMNDISESETSFPHRNGNLFMIVYQVTWEEEGAEVSQKHLDSVNKLYMDMAPYVSKSPRSAYVNVRDLDLGKNKNGTSTYEESKAWGTKYFKNNFERLVQVKSKFDPQNFFRHEQSIPSVPFWVKKINTILDAPLDLVM